MGEAYRHSVENVLGKDHSLELNDEEVDELLQVLRGRLQCLPWDCVVPPWPEGRCQALRE